MTGKPSPIKCKSCARTLATVSPEGLTKGPSAEGCSTCEEFTSLHDAMRAADEAYLPLITKGDKHRGKQAALAEAARTRMVFHNYLMSVEDAEPRDEGSQNGNEKEQQSGKERTSEEGGQEQHLDGNIADNQPSEIGTSQQLAHRLSSKRTHSVTCILERKRIKFDDSVEFREDYRPYLELNRSNKDYVPGRYAPPEEGYLDTSGSEISALKFTGMKRVKGGWVEVIPKERKSKKEALKMSSELQECGSLEDVISQEEADSTLQKEIDRPKLGLLDPRAERLQRRTKKASSADAAESGDKLTRNKKVGTQKPPGASLNRIDDEISGPFNGTPAVAPQEEGPDDLHLLEKLEDVGEPFTSMHLVSKDDSARDGAFDAQPANPQPSGDSNRNVASYQLREDGEAQLNSVHINTGGKESKGNATTQAEVAQSNFSAATSNKPSWNESHDAHPKIHGTLSTIQDCEITGSTDKKQAEPKRANEQEREYVSEGGRKPSKDGYLEANLGEEKEKSAPEIEEVNDDNGKPSPYTLPLSEPSIE